MIDNSDPFYRWVEAALKKANEVGDEKMQAICNRILWEEGKPGDEDEIQQQVKSGYVTTGKWDR